MFSALLVIDVQKCFIEGGSLPINGGRQLVPLINEMLHNYKKYFKKVIFSLDFHPANHISFASQHLNKSVLDHVTLNYDKNGAFKFVQTLWPDHCVENTTDSKLADELNFEIDDVTLLKGTDQNIDSYSAFYDVGRFSQTALHSILTQNNIKNVFVVGIATDFCVKFTALDANYLGYTVYVVEDLTRGVSENSVKEALNEMEQDGLFVNLNICKKN
ncbi:hypothetical protein HELRODRAFT_71646 [Helobdella robusta]|uniref:nicotinamidase n=1 Tax=Helobdella robusta TaxID=6412 RepID=T1G0P7_HELRO|nr:hypothetical protein HELRODRAFT_71646 [Helobdella robusta]ESO11853.1 hypothetical protein HELRODRAFT_71646 [Helobdella robusta]